MAKATQERLTATEQDQSIGPEIEQEFLDILGPSAGPEAYLHMTAIVEMLERIPDPAIAGALETHIATNGINRNLIVVDSSTSIIVANSPEHAQGLKREILYRRMVQLGKAILRAPQ